MMKEILIENLEVENVLVSALVQANIIMQDDSFSHEFGVEEVIYPIYDPESVELSEGGEVIAFDEDGEELNHVPLSAWQEIVDYVEEKEIAEKNL